MTEYVIIAGHGKNPNGSWDSGAVGNGYHEATYVREKILATMKKYVPDNQKFTFVTDKNVYSHSSMADYKGKVVVEVHLDAFTPTARGGHVIVHKDFAPDKIDLAIRDVISKYIGVRYNHMGHKGISGRSDLRNPTLAKIHNINYRLIECAFISNKQDMDLLNKHLEVFSRDLVRAICGASKELPQPSKVNTHAGAKVYTVRSGDTLWGISKATGVSIDNLKAWNNLKSDLIVPNQVLNLVKPATNEAIGTVTVIANELWYYNRNDWNAKAGIAKKGDVFTVIAKVKATDGDWLYKLKSGMFITTNEKFIRFNK